ncbi:response regulator [Clostridium chromiireducens]|uniref:Stage 0 sporulation protein A homolog n=1 Tax=Clostridium chromiireducens TaxID=225345 RepID=A0A1V4ID66_9CLOT|nr:response regulator [Clostridium chromiireducens]OPJ57886.1 CAI-1 autoinducer sensor kinase/phosphatase CqsS [Clostridium chromiireducens]RII35545.1 response regulator [Clostridium chromiireducens]
MSEKQKNILLVEDMPSVRKFISLILENADYNVIEASNGEEGIEIYKKSGNIDLIITDIYMPQKTGLELVVELREEYSNINVIVLSDGGENNFSNELGVCEALGATYFIKKDMIIDELIELVEKIFSK